MLKYKGRQIEVDGITSDGDLIDVETAYYVDTGEEIAVNELTEVVENNYDKLHEYWLNDQIEKAENYFDLMNDR